MNLYEQTGAYHQGHFLLASGQHAPKFLQSTTVMQYPEHAQTFGEGIANLFDRPPDFVLGPAMGGVVLAHEVAKALGCRALFAEKDGEGGMYIREAFSIAENEHFIAVEDVVTTGGSLMKGVRAAQSFGATCLGLGCIIDRGQARLPDGLILKSLLELHVDSYEAANCPLCVEGVPLQEL